jgi:hypothetical protein
LSFAGYVAGIAFLVFAVSIAFGFLQVRFWLPGLAFVPVIILFGVVVAASALPKSYRPGHVALLALIGFAWGQGAAFHIGTMAIRWGILSFVPVLALFVICYRAKRDERATSAAAPIDLRDA